MAQRFYVTTPIYYVNDTPHIGHAYTTILADVLARFHRLLGEEVRFQTGTDEHGMKVQQAARQRGVDEKTHCDEVSRHFRAMWERLGIRYDTFFRTTQEDHYAVVGQILQRIYDNGDIVRSTYKGWYSIRDEMFISADDAKDRAEDIAACRVVQMEEENYFFRLANYQDWLVDHIRNTPNFIVPDSRKNEVLGMLREPLDDLCISRPKSRLAWGIPLPFDDDYVTYVWFDALINYVTGIGYNRDDAEFARWWPHVTHLIGKDILKPHGVFWPIMLRAAGIDPPRQLVAHGWWTRGGQKESKTKSEALAAQAPVRHIRELVDDYGADAIRYFLLREMTLGMDQDYDEHLIATRINAELANDLGNLSSRVIKIVQRDLGGTVPARVEPGEAEAEVWQCAREARDRVPALVRELKPNLAIQTVMETIRATNRYFNSMAPWKLLKDGDTAGAGRVCYVGLEVLRWAAVLLAPVMPERMAELRRQLGAAPEPRAYDEELQWGGLAPGTPVPGGDPLFPRIDMKALEQRLEIAVQAQQAETAHETAGLVSIDDFGKLELRTAVVREAERVPKADKLLKLQIEVGDERRQIVAGIAQDYAPEDVIGKRIVIVANLEPAKIRGIESRGMLLAAKKGKRLTLVTTDDPEFASGASVS